MVIDVNGDDDDDEDNDVDDSDEDDWDYDAAPAEVLGAVKVYCRDLYGGMLAGWTALRQVS